MAVVDRADSDVVVLVGVPLVNRRQHPTCSVLGEQRVGWTYGISLGVPGFDDGVGRLMSIGPLCCDMVVDWAAGRTMGYRRKGRL